LAAAKIELQKAMDMSMDNENFRRQFEAVTNALKEDFEKKIKETQQQSNDYEKKIAKLKEDLKDTQEEIQGLRA